MSRNYRPLLPVGSSSSETGQTTSISRDLPPKRPYAGAGACDNCRFRKIRCDRNRPSCRRCLVKNLPCLYSLPGKTAQQSQHKELAGVVNKLISLPEDEALEMLKTLRRDGDPSATLSLYQSSGARPCRATTPPVFAALELELSARHSKVYPILPPVDTSKIDPWTSATGIPRRSSVQWPLSLDIVAAEPMENEVMEDVDPIPDNINESSIWSAAGFENGQDLSQFLNMSYWTTIPIGNELAATVITNYLAGHNAMFRLFDTELFLDDLLARRLNFCSAFLVHSVFSCACLWSCDLDPNLSRLSREFLGVAEALWRAERRSDSVLNVAAIIATSVACEIQVSGIPLVELFEDARDMAERLCLFGTRDSTVDGQSLSASYKRQSAQVAWGAYNWLSLNIYYVPIKPICYPPTAPIPGESTDEVTAKHLVDKIFGALCRLWVIVQEVAAVYSLYRHGSDKTMPLSFAEDKYRKLLQWADNLDSDLVQGEGCFDQVILLHIFFHSAVLDIFMPFCLRPGVHALGSFSSPDSTAESVSRISTDQLKRILLTCRITRRNMLGNMTTGTAVCHVFNQVLQSWQSSINNRNTPCMSARNDEDDGMKVQEPEQNYDPDWHFYLLLCISHCQELSVCYPVFLSVGRGLLGMALQAGALSVDEVLSLETSLQTCSIHRSTEALGGDFGDFVIDFELAAKVPREAQVKVVATRLEEMIRLDSITQNMCFGSE